jgi:hypothetical protein
VILDETLRPWLLEVNASPSMARENELDRRIKNQLIRDTVALVDPLPFDREALVKIIERRHRNLNVSSAGASKVGGVQQHDLGRDLYALLQGRLPRQTGEAPRFCGNFDALAPGTTVSNKVMKILTAVSKKARSDPAK